MTNQCNVSDDTIFHLHWCYFMEDMTSTFYFRIDKLCIFMQLLLGSAVIGNIMNTTLIGLTIAIIAAYQFSCNPAKIANSAKQQALSYSGLIHDINNHDDVSIRENMKSLEPKDSPILLSIRKASYIQSAVATGNMNTADAKLKKLNLFNRMIISLAGGIQH
jgi:L-cystine uptake protein TcyP (sodium:dicarboxylate symporter family)